MSTVVAAPDQRDAEPLGGRGRDAAPRNGRGRRLVAEAAALLLLVCLAMFIVGPLVWLASRAFAVRWDFPNLHPTGWTLRWWRVVVDDPAMKIAVTNSISFAVLTVLLSSVICLPAAYAFARFRFFGRRAMLIGLFATNAFPRMGLFVAMASLFYALNLMQTQLGVLIVHIIGTVVFMTWIPAAAFGSVPRSLEEAARDAGASPLRVFATVTLPLAMPGIAVAMIMSFLASFDEAQGTYLVGAPDYMTMPTQMYSLVLNYPNQVSAVFSILLSIPSIVLLSLIHRQIMGGQLAEGFQVK